jgi:hypothetical protein
MGYVMVPIPEELVVDVIAFMLREKARLGMEPWDQPSMDQLFAEVDESARSLLAFVAREAMANRDLGEAEAAAAMQMNWREVYGVFRDLNERVGAANRPGLMGMKTVTETLAGGQTTEVRSYSMSREIAELVTEAERADLAADLATSEPAG